MRVEYRSFTAGPQSPALELMSAFRSVSNYNERPHLLGYTPAARLNPFQALLYKEFSGSNIAVAPILRPDKFRSILDFKGMAETTSLHLHWNSWMTFGESDESRARTLGMGMVARLEQLRAKGVNIIWTVHNVYPHDAIHIDLELNLQQRIAEISNVVHVMSNSTVDVMREYCALDERKIIYAPHPNYRGAYADVVSRAESRAMLGLEADEVVFLLFGAIKPYKGLSRLISAIDILSKIAPKLRFRVLVAGGSDGSIEAHNFIDAALLHPKILLESNKVPNERAQYFLRAADVGLVNYERLLNSGAALLYGTFSLPLVAADVPPLREGLHEDSTTFVEDASPEAFAQSMLEAASSFGDQSRLRGLMGHMNDLDPEIVSAKFGKDLVGRLEGTIRR